MKDPKRSKKVYIFGEIVRIENRFAAISYYDQISHNIILPSPPFPKKGRIGRRSVKKMRQFPEIFSPKGGTKECGRPPKKRYGEKTKVFLVSQFEDFFNTFFASVRQQQK